MADASAVRTTSPWLESVPDEQRYPQLTGSVTADVCVVGAGIAGVMTAWELSQAGVDVVLVEKNHVATGDTGYTTAFCTRVADTSFSDLVKRYGQPFVKEVFAATTAAQDRLFAIIEQERLTCSFAPCRSFYIPAASEDVSYVREEWEAIRGADPKAHLIEGAEAQKACGQDAAIAYEREGRFDVRQFLFALLARPVGKRIRIFEESEVLSMTVEDQVFLRAAQGSITAHKVVVCTGLPATFVTDMQSAVQPKVTYAIAATYPNGAPVSDDLFWDTDEPYFYYRRLNGSTIVLGGADRYGNRNQDGPDAPYTELREYLTEHFKGTPTITHQWSGTIFASEDGLPFADAHPNYPGKVFIGTGLNGNGMVMGSMLGTMLADAARGVNSSRTFAFARTKERPTPAPDVVKTRTLPLVSVLQGVLTALFAAVIALPAVAFFLNRGGIGFLDGADFRTANILLFPLLGLYAFTLVWLQIILGSSMDLLRRVFPRLVHFHRSEGIFALTFALLHPAMILVGYGPAIYLRQQYVSADVKLFVWFGYVQLLLLIVTVASALFMRLPLFRKRWRLFHYLNYVVFASAWVHSWFLGTDIQATWLRFVWFFFGATAVLATALRIYRQVRRTAAQKARTGSGSYIRVAAVSEIQEGVPHCVKVKGQAIALFKVRGSITALNNTCSHAGGPLCKGTQMGPIIVCPWHGSRFDVTTGAVVGGPARTAQRTYPVRIRGDSIEIAV